MAWCYSCCKVRIRNGRKKNRKSNREAIASATTRYCSRCGPEWNRIHKNKARRTNWIIINIKILIP